MRPILSATNSYNFKLAKWLEEKLQPLSVNSHSVNDVFDFAKKLQSLQLSPNDIFISYDVESLFTNVPVDETIDIIVDKAFQDNWFNETNDLNITRDQLKELLEIATKNQLFTFQDQLYEQVDGVAMGSPLGPLMANVFMCHIEEKLEIDGLLPEHYYRFVDDTLTSMPGLSSANNFLKVLNEVHPSIRFTNGVTRKWGNSILRNKNQAQKWKYNNQCLSQKD